MSARGMRFALGTLVWFKAADRIWWPARIVHPTQTPEEFQWFINSKKKVLGVVFFEREKYYDIIINESKVCLYSSRNKIKFVRKGHDLYLRQCAGKKTYFDMSKFMDDVLQFEKEIGGDLNIFKKIPLKEEVPQKVKDIIKELFPRKSSRKGRKSSLKARKTMKPENFKFKCTMTKRCNFKTNSFDSLIRHYAKHSKNKGKNDTLKTTIISPDKKPASKKDSSNKASLTTLNTSSSDTAKFICSLINGCNFKTNNYNSLKRHFSEHYKNKGKDDTLKTTIISPDKKPASKKNSRNQTSLTTSKKRKNLKTKYSDTKKINLLHELLKDWSDGEDHDEVVGANFSASTSTAIEKN